jgi:hypothetical protein
MRNNPTARKVTAAATALFLAYSPSYTLASTTGTTTSSPSQAQPAHESISDQKWSSAMEHSITEIMRREGATKVAYQVSRFSLLAAEDFPNINAPFYDQPRNAPLDLETKAIIALAEHCPVTAQHIMMGMPEKWMVSPWVFAINNAVFKRISASERKSKNRKWEKTINQIYDILLASGNAGLAILISQQQAAAACGDEIAYSILGGEVRAEMAHANRTQVILATQAAQVMAPIVSGDQAVL